MRKNPHQESGYDQTVHLPALREGDIWPRRNHYIGPLRTVTCRDCGGKVSVRWASTLIFLLIFVGPSRLLGAFIIPAVGDRPARDLVPLPYIPLALAALMFPVATKIYQAKLRLVKRR
jgi:hypothetical protein